MRTILPHVVAVLHVPALLLVGYGLNVSALAIYTGAVAGLATDPVPILVAIVLGLAVRQWWQLLLAAIGAAIALQIFVNLNNEFASGSALVVSARASVLITVAFAVNLPVIFLSKRSEEKLTAHD